MRFFLNGEQEALEKEYKVTELLAKYELNPNVITVSLNGDLLSKDAFAATVVKDGDAVDILMFMGGGN